MKPSTWLLAALTLVVLVPTNAHATANVLARKGCTECHSAVRFGVHGGDTGPDLSDAASHVQKRYGMSLAAFLRAPRGPMSHVIGSMIRLSASDRAEIVALLAPAAPTTPTPHGGRHAPAR